MVAFFVEFATSWPVLFTSAAAFWPIVLKLLAVLLTVVAACEGVARNPQAAGAIRTTMIIGLALIEALVIYVLVAAFAIK